MCGYLLPTLAGAERGSRVSQGCPNIHCGRVRATEHASRGSFRVLERLHGLADIVERGAVVLVERLEDSRDAARPAPTTGIWTTRISGG